LGVHEVTVGEFRAFVKATGHKTEAEANGQGGKAWNADSKELEFRVENVWTHPAFSKDERQPVVFVTPKDAQAFCRWLSEREGRRYELPSEEQWEFACRAGTTTPWSFGTEETQAREFAWVAPWTGSPKPVGAKKPNPFGLHDMHGNVDEAALTTEGGAVFRG